MTVQEFFEQLPGRADPAKTAGMNNSYVFDVQRMTDGFSQAAPGLLHVRQRV